MPERIGASLTKANTPPQIHLSMWQSPCWHTDVKFDAIHPSFSGPKSHERDWKSSVNAVLQINHVQSGVFTECQEALQGRGGYRSHRRCWCRSWCTNVSSLLCPLRPRDVKQKVKALKISVADSLQLSTKLLAYGSCFKDINAILNYCLHAEGLNEATLRTIYHSVVTWGRYRDEKTSKRGNHV